jgi:hypothetical protein
LKVNVYLSGNPVHDAVLTAFYQGIPASCRSQLRPVDEPTNCDLAVVFGIRKEGVPISYPRGRVIRWQEEEGKPYIVLETGYVKRGDGPEDYYAAGFNGLNGRADFRNKGMPADRWEKLGLELKPWRLCEGYYLVCGQVPWDAAVQHHNHVAWVQKMCRELSKVGEVVFRPHPKAGDVYGAVPATVSTRPLLNDLLEAGLVVTFNSNVGVDATIEGVSATCDDEGSMIWKYGDREQWAANLAYTQWTQQEMAEGLAWSHLFR